MIRTNSESGVHFVSLVFYCCIRTKKMPLGITINVIFHIFVESGSYAEL